MPKNDVVVRTAKDLEKKYNLASLLGLSKNIEINRQGMQKVENELHNFIISTTGDIQDLQSQIDGKVTTWYYEGEPTLDNEPANSWNTEELNEHIGDLYYDKATGYSYIFQYDTEYHWEKIEDADVIEALAIANAAKDTADSKRHVFVIEPTTPYDTGDLWINNNEIFICQVSRKTGEFNSNDWINSLKYTDDTVAYAIREELNTFIAATVADIEKLQNQIDGTITTYYYTGVPTLNNEPAVNWTTDEIKSEHIGDLYYDQTTGHSYRFLYEDNQYKWVEIADSDVAEALRLANEAKDTADSKRRVFATTPFTPYDVGDLWLRNKELYVCKTARTAAQVYSEIDFEKATKYTDDTALNSFISGEYADDLEAINTQIDKKAETWYQSTDPSNNWTTAELKAAHVGDLWYSTTEKKNYTYTSSYSWQEIDGVPDSIYDEIDSKAQIFSSQPTTPYYKGDLYTQGANGDILVCKTERLTGNYVASDWIKAGKYTDDTNLNNFVNVTYTEQVNELNSLINTKITTWYYSGVPTLSNNPASSWTTADLKASHVGDLYYDQSTGYTYRFNYEGGVYSWKHIVDKDLTKALATANEASDTADSKRRIFTVKPTPPYDNGDLWINDKEIYVCQNSKQTGTFATNDFIKATKYTDDTTANEVKEELVVLEGTVQTITKNYVKFTDLSTGGSTTIAGENITTGSIQSNNYVKDKSGTKIALEDGVIDSKNFKVDSEGNIESTGGKIGGFTIGEHELTTNLSMDHTYTQADIDKIVNILEGTYEPTDEELDYLDINGDGELTAVDILIIQKILWGDLNTTGLFQINTKTANKALRLYRSDGTIGASLSTSGGYFQHLGASNINANSIDSEMMKTRNISANNIQSGKAYITPTANAVSSIEVEFNTEFSDVPNVVLTADTAAPYTVVKMCTVSNVTTKGFKINLYRTNTVETGVYWIATL